MSYNPSLFNAEILPSKESLFYGSILSASLKLNKYKF